VPGGEGGPGGQGPASTVGTGDGGSRSEQIGRRLEETFGTFDAAVRTAQADIAKERAEAAGSAGEGESGADESSGDEGESGAGGEGGEGGSGPTREGGLESTGAGGDAGSADSGEDAQSSVQGGVGGGASGGKGPQSIPADIPDGRDDDIVARQIREAAMKETDPELREALWEEYRRYKKGS
jgi:hypothetical protein